MEAYQVRTPYRVASRQPVKVTHLINIDSGFSYTPLCRDCDARLAVWVREGFIAGIMVYHQRNCAWWIAGVKIATAEMAEFWASIMEDRFVPTAPEPPEWARPA